MIVIEFLSFIFKDIIFDLVFKGFLALVRGRPIFFRGWRLRHEPLEAGIIFFDHRGKQNDIFWRSFKSEKDVLFITIKSLHTLIQLSDRLLKGEINVKSLDILTLDPGLADATFELLSQHLAEPKLNCKEDVVNAYKNFKELEQKYSFIHVRKYKSLPTMQGVIVKGERALVEYLTYHTVPNERRALFLSKDKTPNTLKFFEEKFLNLWNQSKD